MRSVSLLDLAMKGLPLRDTLIIDCHWHLGYWGAETYWFTPDRQCDVNIEVMDNIGIDMVCANNVNIPPPKCNDLTIECVQKYPDRIVGFASVNPFYPDEVRDELERCFKVPGVKGIKVVSLNVFYLAPLPLYRIGRPESALYQEVWDFAAEKRCPILCHGIVTEEIVRDNPDTIFIPAHSAPGWEWPLRLSKYDNVYFDTASTGTLSGSIEYLIKRIGADRILYGSDFPASDPAFRLGTILSLKIKEEDKEKIMGLNMKKLLENVKS